MLNLKNYYHKEEPQTVQTFKTYHKYSNLNVTSF